MTPAGEQGGAAPDTREMDPGLARDRTALAWTRSALSLLAIGTLIARAAFVAHLDLVGVISGAAMATLALLTWRHGRVIYRERAVPDLYPHHQPGALGFLMAVTLIAAVVALVVTVVV